MVLVVGGGGLLANSSLHLHLSSPKVKTNVKQSIYLSGRLPSGPSPKFHGFE
jgi:hypothetical protein